MDALYYFYALGAFLFGVILGSFLNALLFRYQTGTGIGGRSHCMNCGHTLSAFDLVPIFSYLLLFGRCRYCSSKISIQYPLVELTAGLLVFGVFLHFFSPELFSVSLNLFSVFSFLFSVILWLLFLFLFVYDLRHKILPFSALALTWICSLLLILLSYFILPTSYFLLHELLAGPAVASPLLLISLFSRGRAMGWGDGLLSLSIGWLLGLSGGMTALVLAFWSGAIVGLGMIAYSNRALRLELGALSGKLSPHTSHPAPSSSVTMKSEIPFGPFLLLGTVAVYFFHIDLFALIF